MEWSELLDKMKLDEIEVTIIKPTRKEESYKKGRITGFKCGIFGGGHYKYKNGQPMAYDSSRRHWIKKPMIHVTYPIFTYGGKEHSDWIPFDNCDFNFKSAGEKI